MICPSQEKIIEFALRQTCGEPISSEWRHIEQHLPQCPACTARVREYTQAIHGARHAFPVHAPSGQPCLDDNVLAAYVDHTLPREERDAVEEHLAACQACLRSVAELARLTESHSESPAESPSLIQYVVQVAKDGLRLLSLPEQGFSLLPYAAMQALGPNEHREDGSPVQQWIQSEGELALHFTLRQVDDRHVNMDLAFPGETPCPSGVRLQLYQEGHLLQSEEFSEEGRISLQNLSIENYDGQIRIPRGQNFAFAIHFRTQ